MPLLLDPSLHSVENLRVMLRGMAEEAREIEAGLRDPAAEVRRPLGLMTAAELTRDVAHLAELVDRPGADAATLAAVVNVQYDAMIAAIELMKSSLVVPMVPRRRT